MILDRHGNQIDKILTNNQGLSAVIGNRFETWSVGTGSSYSSHYTIHKGIDLLADSVAQLPVDIYRGDELMPKDFVFPGGFDLHNPHPRMSLNELIYTACIYFWFRGEFMLLIDQEGFMTLEPINPKDMVLQKDGSWKWNNKKIIQEEDLIYAKLLNPDGERGLSPVDVVKAEIDSDISAGRYATKFFDNYAQLGGTIEDAEGKITTKEMEKIVGQFNNAHSGQTNSHKVLGLPKGIKYQAVDTTMREMDFLSSRKDIRDKILAVLGIHKALFGVTDQVNRSVAEEASRQLWTLTLRPKVIRIQEKFNQQFIKKMFPGYRIQFDFSVVDALKQNAESVLAQAKGYRDLGYTLNEINEHFNLGMEEVTDTVGETRFVPFNMVPVDEVLFAPEILEIPTKELDSNSIDKVVALLDNTVDKSVRTYTREYKRIQRKSERTLTGKLRKYFAKQLGIVLGVINSNKGITATINKGTVDTTLLMLIQNTLNKNKNDIIVTLQPVYEEINLVADILAIEALSLEVNAVVDATVVADAVNKISNINNHTYRLIKTQVTKSMELGETTEQLAKRITNVYKFSASRARTIARTESSAMISRTTNARYLKEGVTHKRWVAVNDNVTRQTHSENDGVGVVPYSHIYASGMKFPGDPSGGASEVVSCRCTLVPVVN